MNKKAMGLFLTFSLLMGCLAGLTFNKNNAKAADIDFSGKYKKGKYTILMARL